MVPRNRMALWVSALAFGACCESVAAQTPPAPAQPAQPPSPRLADTIEQRVAACAICHGKQGEGTGARSYYPRISGKPSRFFQRRSAPFGLLCLDFIVHLRSPVIWGVRPCFADEEPTVGR